MLKKAFFAAFPCAIALVLPASSQDVAYPHYWAPFYTNGTLTITLSSVDAAGRPLSTWHRITGIRYTSGGTGTTNTSFSFHLTQGWSTFGTFPDDGEWNEDIQFKDIRAIHTSSAKPDTVAQIAQGGIPCVLFLIGD